MLDVVETVDALTTNNDNVNIFYDFLSLFFLSFFFLFFCLSYDNSLSI